MPVPHGFKSTAFVKTSKHERMVDPAGLSPERKQLLWAGIKKLNPGLAEILQLDTDFDELKKALNATVRFSQADFERFTKAGRLIIGEKQNV